METCHFSEISRKSTEQQNPTPMLPNEILIEPIFMCAIFEYYLSINLFPFLLYSDSDLLFFFFFANEIHKINEFCGDQWLQTGILKN